MATPRLPIPGGDDGSWGDILNSYLSVAHNADGTLAPNSVSSAQIQAGSIPASKLDSAVQTSLGKADSALQSAPVTSVASKTGAVTLTKSDVGLGNVDNTSDANKPISSANQTALDLKAPLASPAFTGTPTSSGSALATQSDIAGLSGTYARSNVPTAVKSANYTAAASDFVPLDTSAGSVTVTLPTAPTDKTTVAVKIVTGWFPATVAAGGSDVFNVAGGLATLTLIRRNQGVELQYKASTSIWYVLEDSLPASMVKLFDPATSRKARKGLANVRSATADMKILCVGDSTTGGVGIANITNVGSPLSYPYQLAAILNGYIPSAQGLGIPPYTASADTRWTAGTGWALTTQGMGTNACYTGTAPSGSLVYTPGPAAGLTDRYDVYYLSTASTGTIHSTATGGSTVDTATAGTTAVNKVTISAASAATSNTVTITATGAVVYIIGIEPWNSTTKRVRVGNAGVGSSRAAGWASSLASNISPTACIKAYAPDLTIISLGLNDANDGTSVATFLGYIASITAAAAVSGDVIIMSPIPPMSTAVANVLAWIPPYTAALPYQGYPYADLAQRWKSGDDANTLGMFGVYTGNSLHPNEIGYADIAQFVAQLILAA